MNKRNAYKYNGIDFTGQRFGRLVVLEKAPIGRSQWICKCDCGNIVTLVTYKLLKYKSCGCLEKENKQKLSEHTKIHGMTNTILYSKWHDMKSRCTNKNDKHYALYGGRGIKVCEEWLHSFENFRDWAYSSGYDDKKKGYEQTLDRIDVNGNYGPKNCRWADHRTQCNNKQNSIHFEFNGKTYWISQFTAEFNVPYHYVRRRLIKGDKPKDIIDRWNKKHSNERN